MLSPYILTALAHERHQTLLARAETSGGPGRRGCTGSRRAGLVPADRRCANAQPGYSPAGAGCWITGRSLR
jgi:hypothetical protein